MAVWEVAPVPGVGQIRAGRHRSDIQGLRAVAVVLVLAFHAGLPVPGGFVGVDVFFVISGFVITAMLLRELNGTSRLDFGAFYSRRARRLLPALAVVIVSVAVGASILLGPLGQQKTATTGGVASLFAANAELLRTKTGYFDAPAAGNPLLHTWSLAVEEQFYILFPLSLLGAWRVARRRGWVLSPRATTGLLLVVVSLASLLLSVALTRHSTGGTKIAFYGSPTRAWEFAIGGLIALCVPTLLRLNHTVALAAGFLGIALIGYASKAITATTPFPGTAVLIPVVGAALVLIAGTATTGGVSTLLSVRPAVWLGDISYGWYLWHWPAIVFARVLWPVSGPWFLAGAAILSLAPTWISYRWMEHPLRLNQRLIGRRVVPLVATCLIVPITACAALWLTARIASSTGTIKSRLAQAALHADSVRGCEAGAPVGQTKAVCTWTTPNASGEVILIGDSNAGHFTEPAVRAANGQGFDLTVATGSACPFVDLVVEKSTMFDAEGCRHFVTRSLTSMEKNPPRLVIIGSAASLYLRSGNGIAFRDPVTGAVARTESEKARMWERGLNSVLSRLSRAGIPAIVVHTVPQFSLFDIQQCPAYRLYTQKGACGTYLSRQLVTKQQRVALAAETDAIVGVPQATGVDFSDDLCTPVRCSTNAGDQWIYRDGAHLSIGGALRLTGRFIELIRLHAR